LAFSGLSNQDARNAPQLVCNRPEKVIVVGSERYNQANARSFGPERYRNSVQ